MKVVVRFKNKELEWHIGLTLQFNGHADDKKAVRKAIMSELDEKKMSKAKGFVQGFTIQGGK